MEVHIDNPLHIARFIELNEQWISEFFELEESDRKLAQNPLVIIENGGAILTATENESVVGSCALFKHSEEEFELARMAVDPEFQSQGIGRALAQRVISIAAERGGKRIKLLTNTVLEPAIALYKSLGFVVETEGQHPIYARCNIVMSKVLTSVG